MRKFFKDFKAFISRGNIIDMAVGVIIGSAFSAIVTSLTNKIIMPLINWLLSIGGKGLDSAYTFLKKVETLDAAGEPVVDLAKSIYIDWGAFITAIIDFLLIALVLFIILKAVMKSSALLREASDKAKQGKLTKEQKKELKALGINHKDKEAVALYLDGKQQEENRLKAEADEKAKIEEEENGKNSSFTNYSAYINSTLYNGEKRAVNSESKKRTSRISIKQKIIKNLFLYKKIKAEIL